MKVSVIVPVYNAEKTLPRCVESMLAQTCGDFELLLIDNNSKDASVACVERFAAGDARIRVLHQPRQGVSAARNMGLDAAQGEYIFFLDSDDALSPDALERMLPLTETMSMDMVAPGMCRIAMDAQGQERARTQLTQQDSQAEGGQAIARLFADNLYRYGLFNITMMHRRSLVDMAPALRFDESLSLGEDVLFNIQVMRRSKRIATLSAGLYDYYYRFGSETLNTRYRPDMVEIKQLIADQIEDYLRSAGVWDNNAQRSFYAMCTQDAFNCVSNILRAPDRSGKGMRAQFKALLALPRTQRMLAMRGELPVSIGQRAFLTALSTGLWPLARAAVWVYGLLNR